VPTNPLFRIEIAPISSTIPLNMAYAPLRVFKR
jgi:hypothetical protein